MLSGYPREAVERAPERLAIGGSELRWADDHLRIRFAERGAVGGRPVEGEVRLYPSATFDAPLAIDRQDRHFWWAVAPHSRVEVELRRPRPLSFVGDGYHDANFGGEALDEGFASWTWSRARLADRTVVLYDGMRRDGSELRLGRAFTADGAILEADAPQPATLGRSRWGIPRATRCAAGGRARAVRTLLDAPFYARSEIVTDLGEGPVRGVHESLSLDRFRSGLVQHMLGYRSRRESM